MFTTVPASQIEGAMRAWNGISDKHPVDFVEFRRGLPRGRPLRVEQRRAADRVIAQIERKLAKASYQELLERYGYGTLVVGMPLWFAVPPDDPFRAENAIDDFMTRTELGLEDVTRRVLRRRDCPFRKVVVVWDTTPQALREWRKGRSSEYGDAANASLENPMGVALWGALSDGLENAISKTGTPESEAPSMSLHLDMKTNKKASGTGPYPELVEAFGEVLRRGERASCGALASLEIEGRSDAVEAALFCANTWGGRVGKGGSRESSPCRTRGEGGRHGERHAGSTGKADAEVVPLAHVVIAMGLTGAGEGRGVHGNAGQALGRGDA